MRGVGVLGLGFRVQGDGALEGICGVSLKCIGAPGFRAHAR